MARGGEPDVAQLANTGSLGSPAASPAFVLAQACAAHGVRVAPFVRGCRAKPTESHCHSDGGTRHPEEAQFGAPVPIG